MASQGPKNCVSGTDDVTVGTIAWTNPGFITTCDGSEALAGIALGVKTHYAVATNFQMTVPAAALILGISVTVVKESANDIVDSKAILNIGGVDGINLADTITPWVAGTPTPAVYGSNIELWGFVGKVGADINGANLVFKFSAAGASPAGGIAFVDCITATVYYQGGSKDYQLAPIPVV